VAIDGQKIRELRNERGYSLYELAEKAGLSLSYLSEIERGCKNPSLKTVKKLAEALHVPQEQLIGGAVRDEIKLGERIRLFREKNKLTLKELAQKAGISVSYLSEIERGNVAPAVETLRKVAHSLDCPVSALIASESLFGQRLRQVRLEQGFTQTELARRAGLSPGLIGQLEQGKVKPSLQSVKKIADVLGLSPCYFIAEEATLEDMLRLFPPDARELLAEPEVQAVLRQLCGCSEKELRFIIDFIKLFKKLDIE
jgi:transcriptional regulator with XRE-family HTH domain